MSLINDDFSLLWIEHFLDVEQQIHWYHIRQVQTEQYKNFYRWHSTKKLHYGADDFPHDYFVYLNEADRLEMHEKFAQYLEPVKERRFHNPEFYDFTIVIDLTHPNVMVGNILQQEITNEINKEIIATILKR